MSHVSAYEVAYEAYALCPSEYARTLEIAMLGADRLEMAPRESVADPLLVVVLRLLGASRSDALTQLRTRAKACLPLAQCARR